MQRQRALDEDGERAGWQVVGRRGQAKVDVRFGIVVYAGSQTLEFVVVGLVAACAVEGAAWGPR